MKKFTLFILSAFTLIISQAQNGITSISELQTLVDHASELVRVKGEDAFTYFRVPDSRWRHGDTYIFVLDPSGNMIVHADKEMEGKNQVGLKDVNGKHIIRGLIESAAGFPGKEKGWYHYQFPEPGGLLPRWKSSYVQLVQAPGGKKYIVGSGIYTDRMEKEFVVDAVQDAVALVERNKDSAFALFHDPTSRFIAKDAYIFVIDSNGVDLVNPAFPNLEGFNILDVKDTRGKHPIREMVNLVQKQGEGWIDYMWPKPGESVSTQKSAYVSRARLGDEWVLVGSGIYPADAPKETATTKKITAPELVSLVREAADVFRQKGEKAYEEFRVPGTKWYHDDTYFFVWSMDGKRTFHAAKPESEGQDVSSLHDVLSRPMGKMFLEAAASKTGEGWVHYMWPEPGDMFPAWKSSYIKRVTFPSGKSYLVGCGIYNMDMNRDFIEDVVNRAALLVQKEGPGSFAKLRDKKGPYFFMDTYVFVEDVKGNELVNAGHPSLEGKNLMQVKDLHGKQPVKEYIEAAMKNNSAWVEYHWYLPGDNRPAHKYSYVRKVTSGNKTYIVGAGFYGPDADAE